MNALARGLAPRMRPLPARRPVVVAALDIGSSKLVCLIARLKPRPQDENLRRRTHNIEVLGFGHIRARGIKGGAVADMARAEEAIRHVVDMAERSAGVEIASVVVGVSGGRLASESFAASHRLPHPSVQESDIGRVLDAASLHSVRDGRAVLHSLPVGYRLDNASGVRDPRAMLGEVLAVDLHVVTADRAALKNLVLLVERCHLTVEGLIAAPYAAGLAVLTDDEAELGATVIDFGAGTTTLAAFAGGHCVHVDGIALGGRHVTMDIARGLATRVAEAERLKSLHGSAIASSSDDLDVVTVPAIADERDGPNAVARAQLVRVVRSRVEEILELLRDRLKAANMLAAANRRIVLTGGAAELMGLPESVARLFRAGVRLGKPLGISGLNEAARGLAFAASAGLLIYPQFASREHFEPRRRHAHGEAGYLVRVGRWLKESF
jgi:cell division protein FtsA